MKKCSRLSVLVLLAASSAWAVDWKALKPQGYVSDFAGAIDAASRQQLENYCTIVERSTGAQMALVTIPSLEGEPIEDVANTIFRGWGVGQKVLVMIIPAAPEAKWDVMTSKPVNTASPEPRALILDRRNTSV